MKKNITKENITYRGQIRQLLTSVDIANVLLALHIIEGAPDLKEELRVLEELDLSNQQLTDLPVMLFECRNLKELNLSKNELTSLAPEIRKLKKLRKLNLSHNQLRTLPNEIAKLELKKLDLRYNLLEKIPTKMLSVFSSNLSSAAVYLKGNTMFDLDNIKQSSEVAAIFVKLFAVYSRSLDLSIPKILAKRVFWATYRHWQSVCFVVTVVISLIVLFMVRIFTNNFWAFLSSGLLFSLLELFFLVAFYLLIRRNIREALVD